MTHRHEYVDDLARLPTHAFGSRSLTWWGQAGIVAIEGFVFVLAGGAYFFLMSQEPQWPPPGTPLPGLLYSTVFTLLLLASEWPNVRVKKAAERLDLPGVRRGMLVMVAVGVLLLALRAAEFTALNIRWDANAYGSILWALLILHTVHLATDFVDTVVLAVLVHTPHGDAPRKHVDASENALYWHFVVVTWLPIYALLYWVQRLQ